MTAPLLAFDFNPDQPRDDHGRWTSDGGGDSPATDATKGLASGYRDGGTGRVGMGDVKMSAKDIALMRHEGATGAKYLSANGTWTPERQALHDRIVNQLTAGVPSVDHPTYTMLGGGPGAGKSTLLRSGEVALPDQYVHIDADAIKGMLPEVQAMQAAGNRDWAAMSHEESSYLAKRVGAAAIERSQPVVLDGTGDSSTEKLIGKIDAARNSGYKVDGVYVSRDEEASVAGAMIRAEQSGRAVPEDVIRGTFAGLRATVPEAAPHFDTFRMYDVNHMFGSDGKPIAGTTPNLIAQGGGGKLDITDQAGWQRFLNGGPPG